MKIISRVRALRHLAKIREDLSALIAKNFEHKAKDCGACDTPGACCLDAHFVNVHISRLEAEAIRAAIEELPAKLRENVEERIVASIREYGLTADGNTFEQKFACPLYQKGVGCLVHHTAKPLPCVTHACYEKRADLPPDSLLEDHELRVDELNECTYGRRHRWLPIPLALASKGRIP